MDLVVCGSLGERSFRRNGHLCNRVLACATVRQSCERHRLPQSETLEWPTSDGETRLARRSLCHTEHSPKFGKQYKCLTVWTCEPSAGVFYCLTEESERAIWGFDRSIQLQWSHNKKEQRMNSHLKSTT